MIYRVEISSIDFIICNLKNQRNHKYTQRINLEITHKMILI